MTKEMTTYHGDYILMGDFIALRDSQSNSWRISKITVRGTDVTLHMVEEVDHFNDVKTYINNHS